MCIENETMQIIWFSSVLQNVCHMENKPIQNNAHNKLPANEQFCCCNRTFYKNIHNKRLIVWFLVSKGEIRFIEWPSTNLILHNINLYIWSTLHVQRVHNTHYFLANSFVQNRRTDLSRFNGIISLLIITMLTHTRLNSRCWPKLCAEGRTNRNTTEIEPLVQTI